ncbi:MAG TPA: V-type ATP synthase subunit D [Thiolapillus brandeum]|uniref:V-type ATP synthase subunit D n=1 Tax=Thiolapillus brandeum TaxID=1076588 RepID=A0A7C5N8K6_9GAMM|nr:V-type ATP synthase subunit D [Thiolapillus brandeum]
MKVNLPPTRSNLLHLREQHRFLVTGHDLLERKRELLARMVRSQLETYRTLRREAARQVALAYRWLGITNMRMGSRMLAQAALGLEPTLELEILPRSNLGVEYPSVQVTRKPLQPVSLMWSDSSFDRVRLHLAEAAALLARLGEAETTLRRMLAEQRKAQKRVNALQYNIIPSYEASIRFIEETLEEEERAALFQIRKLREGPPSRKGRRER